MFTTATAASCANFFAPTVRTLFRLVASGLALAGALTLAACDGSDETAGTAANTPISQAAAPAKPSRSLPIGTGFDFYVLSLSWSPSYCEAEGEDANGQQCNSGRPYAFVVHGLWPQYEKGWPEDCDAEPAFVADDIVDDLRDIMPSAGLIGYQWRKHGGCSGLSQDDYFGVVRGAREKVAVPAAYRDIGDYLTVAPGEVERNFLSSNNAMSAQGVAITCDDRYLREVRICLTKDLAFRTCPAVDRRACTLKKAVMPPVRGG